MHIIVKGELNGRKFLGVRLGYNRADMVDIHFLSFYKMGPFGVGPFVVGPFVMDPLAAKVLQ